MMREAIERVISGHQWRRSAHRKRSRGVMKPCLPRKTREAVRRRCSSTITSTILPQNDAGSV